MDETRNEWLDETPFSDDIWMNMLVDGELTTQQRSRFINHIRETNDWQRVATVFLDEHVLATNVPFERADSPVLAEVPTTRGSKRTWALAAMAMSLLLGGLIGYGARQPEIVEVVRSDNATTEKTPNEPTSQKKTGLIARASLPALFQAKDTPQEAVYYADFVVPQFLLDALFVAGHKVELEQEFIGYTESIDSPAAVPINVLRVTKYGDLLASVAPSTPNSNQ